MLKMNIPRLKWTTILTMRLILWIYLWISPSQRIFNSRDPRMLQLILHRRINGVHICSTCILLKRKKKKQGGDWRVELQTHYYYFNMYGLLNYFWHFILYICPPYPSFYISLFQPIIIYIYHYFTLFPYHLSFIAKNTPC